MKSAVVVQRKKVASMATATKKKVDAAKLHNISKKQSQKDLKKSAKQSSNYNIHVKSNRY